MNLHDIPDRPTRPNPWMAFLPFARDQLARDMDDLVRDRTSVALVRDFWTLPSPALGWNTWGLPPDRPILPNHETIRFNVLQDWMPNDPDPEATRRANEDRQRRASDLMVRIHQYRSRLRMAGLTPEETRNIAYLLDEADYTFLRNAVYWDTPYPGINIDRQTDGMLVGGLLVLPRESYEQD